MGLVSPWMDGSCVSVQDAWLHIRLQTGLMSSDARLSRAAWAGVCLATAGTTVRSHHQQPRTRNGVQLVMEAQRHQLRPTDKSVEPKRRREGTYGERSAWLCRLLCCLCLHAEEPQGQVLGGQRPNWHSWVPVKGRHEDIFILRKNHFFYIKSNILRTRSKILCKFYVTMFTPEHSLLWRFTPLQPPCQSPSQASNPTCQPPHQALHPTRPAIPPGQSYPPLPLPACIPCLPCPPPQPRRHRERCYVLVLSSSSCKGCMCGVQVNMQPPPIFYTPHLIFYIPI